MFSKKSFLMWAVGLLLYSPAVYAQGACRFGSDQWIVGCEVRCVASWNGSCRDNCTASPPPGTIIAQHRLEVLSQARGGHRISWMPAGVTYSYRERVEESFSSAINAAARAGQDQYAASLRQQMANALRQAQQFDSSHQTIRLEVSARGNHEVFDRARGWSHVRAHILLRCVAPEDLTSQLTSRIAQR